jgi:hypothetical protein
MRHILEHKFDFYRSGEEYTDGLESHALYVRHES